MRILLDECVPLRLGSSGAFAGHQVEHVKRVGLAGLSNGDLHRRVAGAYDLLVTTDIDFKSRIELRPTPKMGVLCIRIVPNTFAVIHPALLALSASIDLTQLVGKLTVLWREHWETIHP